MVQPPPPTHTLTTVPGSLKCWLFCFSVSLLFFFLSTLKISSHLIWSDQSTRKKGKTWNNCRGTCGKIRLFSNNWNDVLRKLFWSGWFLFPIICHLLPFPAQVGRQQKEDGLRDLEDACRIYSINPFCWAGIPFRGSKARKGNNRRRNVYFYISLHSKNSPSTS